jgi:hypothetical protein
MGSDTRTQAHEESINSSVPVRSKHSFRLTDFSTGLAAFAGLASLVYVLGLFVLLGPIMKTYTHDFLTAWHAVSLAPRIAVAGLGVEQLVAFPLLLMTFTYILIGIVETSLLSLRRIVSGKKPENKLVPTARLGACTMTAWGFMTFCIGWYIVSYLPRIYPLGFVTWGVGIMTLLVGGFLGAIVITGNEQVIDSVIEWLHKSKWLPTAKVPESNLKVPPSREQPEASSSRLGAKALGILGAFVGWLLIVDAFWLILRKVGPFLPHLVTVNISSGIDYLIISAVMIVACASVLFTTFAYTEVSLPRILSSPSKAWHELLAGLHTRERNIKRLFWVGFALTFLLAFLLTFLRQPPLPKVEVSGDTHVKGRLLVHTEGFWYVYNGEGQLVAIPDGKVTAVRVFVANE